MSQLSNRNRNINVILKQTDGYYPSLFLLVNSPSTASVTLTKKSLINYLSSDPTEKYWVIYGIREPQSEIHVHVVVVGMMNSCQERLGWRNRDKRTNLLLQAVTYWTLLTLVQLGRRTEKAIHFLTAHYFHFHDLAAVHSYCHRASIT
jgi:hypothetical protein